MVRVFAGIAVAAAFLAAMFFATQREAAVECEVCLDFNGQSACRKAGASDRDGAMRGAIATACAVMSGGVTQGLECDRTPPRSVRCSD